MQLLSEQIVREVDSVEGYTRWAETYDLELNPLIAVEGPRVESILKGLPMRTAIDAGAGTGRHAIVLAKRGVAVTAVDESPEMLAVAREKAARAGLEIDFRIGSLDDRLPADDDRFDFLVCALTLSHIPDIDHAVSECARVVRPGGSILSQTFTRTLPMAWAGRPSSEGRGRPTRCRSPAQPLRLSQFLSGGRAVRSQASWKYLWETRPLGR